MWLEDKWKIKITVQLIFVSPKLKQVVKSKEVQPPIINQNASLIQVHVSCARRIMLATLPDIPSSAFSNTRTPFSYWQKPFGGLWELMSSQWKSSDRWFICLSRWRFWQLLSWCRPAIDPFQKWLPLNYPFVQRSLSCLVHDNNFFRIIMSNSRLVKLFWIWTKDNQSDAILLDFSKAFDSVPHQRCGQHLKKC